MRRICERPEKYNSVIILRVRIFVIWILTLILPFAIVAAYNKIIIGPDYSIRGIEKLNENIWQLDKLNPLNEVMRYFNSQVVSDPDGILDLDKHRESLSKEIIYDDRIIVVIKKDTQYMMVNDITDADKKKVADKIISTNISDIFVFGNTDYSFNRDLRDKSGYVLNNQYDFYFSDGSKGSVFMLFKYADVPSIIMNFAVKYFTVIILVMLVIITHLIVGLTNSLTKPISNFISATEELSKNNLKHRIPKTKGYMLSEISYAYNSALDELEIIEEERLKDEESRQFFIDSLSHDIKTPLTSIEVNANAIIDGVYSSEEDKVKALQIIKEKTSSIDKMIEELKVFSEITSRSSTYHFEKVSILGFVSDILEEFDYENQNKPVRTTLSSEVPVSVEVNMDIYKFKRVLWNILVNSVKYNSDKDLDISVNIKANSGFVEIEFEDNGIGVPQDKLEKIFEKMYRVDDSRNMKNSGSGLGLSIAKSIIESHEGTIEAYNPKGSGLGIRIKMKTV